MPQYDRSWYGSPVRCSGVHFSSLLSTTSSVFLAASLSLSLPPSLLPGRSGLVWSRDCLFAINEACKMGRGRSAALGRGRSVEGERRSRVPSLAYSREKKMTLRPVGRTSASGGPNTRHETRGGGEGEGGRKIGEECLSLSASLPLSPARSLALFLVFPLKSQSTSKLRRAPQEERRGRRGVSARLQYSPARAGPTDSPSAAAAALAARSSPLRLGPRGHSPK